MGPRGEKLGHGIAHPTTSETNMYDKKVPLGHQLSCAVLDLWSINRAIPQKIHWTRRLEHQPRLVMERSNWSSNFGKTLGADVPTLTFYSRT